ncbi:MAG: SDR family oxidoreductase [Gammaproteobacteria bacterium]|nr:SDR family oxidoreductase [Gammaproteobacteria bacterium]NIR82085.1 SDR family oxidoreductase [Gammaproteobacteria bacterium]NIR89318.1 SDR family oxidoreductase [Gammaproteobacteria bacterium]NIU03195.1 SDR family oxidoreductase [Gammaproteobacteria bacterium]NIV50707.1 SDR family oxidoreductase [Gammaproteobacteria bacterium]
MLLTGCSSGIGRCVAEGLRARGYRVFATARREADVDALAALGLEALHLDLTDSASIGAAVEAVLQRTDGTLYGLFNNGAFGQPGAVEDLSREVLRAQFETNFFGWHELTCRVIPVMRRQGFGRIIQNSSVLGLVALKYRGAYNASKFALEGLTDTLRLELSGSGIHVSLIEPGPIESRFRANAYQAFRRNIDAAASAHREAYLAVERRLAQEDSEPPFTLPPAAVLRKVIQALESRRPKPRYYVTVPTHVFAAVKRVLPHRGLDRVLLWLSSR